jgi:tetratricopeptide (TPR) repeat protein
MGWRLLAWTHGTACHFGLAAEASERALEQAELAADARQQTRAATAYAAAAIFGPTPLSEAIARCERVLARVHGDRQSEGVLNALLASLLAMQGEFDRARELSRQGRGQLEELGLNMEVASVANEAWRVEMLAGDPVAAEAELRNAYDLLTQAGEKYFLSTVAGLLAQTLYALERFDEAEPMRRLTEELATADDVSTQALWRCVHGKLLARRGSFEEAESSVLQALEILEPTDHVLLTFGALLDLAEVQRLAGRDPREALERARDLASLKASPVMVATAESLMASAAPA